MAADKNESHVVVKLLVTTNDPSNLTTAVDEREIVLSANIPSIAIGRSSKMVAKGFVPAKDNCWFDSPVMSRNHATLSVNMEDKKVTLVDEQSMHGTTVNFNETPLVPLHPHEVHDGDRITFGQTVNRQKDQFTPTTVELAVNFVDQESAVRTFSPDAADALSADEDSQSLPQLSDGNHRGSLDSWKNPKPDFRPYIDLTSPPPEPRPVDQAISRRADHDDQGGAFKVVDEMSDGYGESIDLSDDGELSDDDVESSLGSSLSGAVVISDDDESDGSSGYPSQDYYERSDDRMWDYGEGWHESDNETDDQDMNPFDGPAPAAFDPWAEPDERTFTLKSILNPTTDRVASPIQEIMVSERPLPTSMDASRAQAASPALGAVLEAPVPAVPEGFVKSLAPVVPDSSLIEPASSVPEPTTEPTASVTEITTSQGFPGRHTSVDFVSNPGEVNLPKGEEAPQTQSVTEFEKRKFQAQVRRAYSLRYWPPDTPLAQSGEAFLNKPLENLPPRTEEETPIDEDVTVTSAATYHKLSKKRKALEISDAPEDAPEVAPVLEVAPRQDHPVQHPESEPRRIKAVGKKQSVRAMARAVAEKLCYAAVGGAVITAGLIYTSPTFA